jgi:8-oxo-dGTP diphosphatase
MSTLTVDGVIFGTNTQGAKVLLIKRKNEPSKGCWAIPGGHVDEEEDLEDAVRREVKEETGLDIDKWTQLKAFAKPHRDPRGRYVTVVFYSFVALRTPPDQLPIAGDDAAEAEWFPIAELPNNLALDHEAILKDAISHWWSIDG